MKSLFSGLKTTSAENGYRFVMKLSSEKGDFRQKRAYNGSIERNKETHKQPKAVDYQLKGDSHEL